MLMNLEVRAISNTAGRYSYLLVSNRYCGRCCCWARRFIRSIPHISVLCSIEQIPGLILIFLPDPEILAEEVFSAFSSSHWNSVVICLDKTEIVLILAGCWNLTLSQRYFPHRNVQRNYKCSVNPTILSCGK